VTVNKPTERWLAVLVISIIVFVITLSILSNEFQSSPSVEALVNTPSIVTQTTLSIAYLSYIMFIVSGIFISYHLKNQKRA